MVKMANKNNLKVEKEYYQGPFPKFQKPQICGYYSLDSQRKLHHDLSQLKYITNPKETMKINFDLNVGYLDAAKKDNNWDEKIDFILEWLSKTNSSDPLNEVDFICFRGLLKVIMCTPFERADGWIICATRVDGKIYLCKFDTDEMKKQKVMMSDWQKRCCSWGYKFEQYLCSSSPSELPTPEQPNDERPEFCLMFTTKLGPFKLLYGAEVDGTDSWVKLNTLDDLQKAFWIELKTSKQVETKYQHDTFVKKILGWWCQSFLVGIDSIICGFRNDHGIINRLENFQTSELAKKGKGYWEPNVCMNFLLRFLTFVKDTLKDDEMDPNSVWCFEWNPGQRVSAKKVEGHSQYSFIRQWFIKQKFNNGIFEDVNK